MTNQNGSNITVRLNDLLSEMEAKRKEAESGAKWREFWIRIYWYGSVFFGALATVSGFVANAAVVKAHIDIQPWMISLSAGIAGGLEVFRYKTTWREKSDTCYALRDTVAGLIARLRYEIPDPPTADQIALISREFRSAKEQYGKRMNLINAREAQSQTNKRGTPTDLHNS
jgi:hypothetical protein